MSLVAYTVVKGAAPLVESVVKFLKLKQEEHQRAGTIVSQPLAVVAVIPQKIEEGQVMSVGVILDE